MQTDCENEKKCMITFESFINIILKTFVTRKEF